MIDIELLGHVVGALGHAAAHVAVHDAKNSLTSYLHRPERLKNRNIEKALKKALVATAAKLREAYARENPEDTLALDAFDALAELDITHYTDADIPPVDAWRSPELVEARMARLFDTSLPEASRAVRRFLDQRFAPLFVFAFREIGLKADPAVRAAVFEAMLARQEDAHGVQTESLRRLEYLVLGSDDALRSGLRDMGYELAAVRTSIAELLAQVQGLSFRLGADFRGDGPVLAYLRVDDARGFTLRVEPMRTRKLVIGRGTGAALQLDDATVSRRHIEVILEPGGALVRDLRAVGESPRHLQLSVPISVGPFRISLVDRDATADQLYTPSTLPPPHP
jgi:hypothetical protein